MQEEEEEEVLPCGGRGWVLLCHPEGCRHAGARSVVWAVRTLSSLKEVWVFRAI